MGEPGQYTSAPGAMPESCGSSAMNAPPPTPRSLAGSALSPMNASCVSPEEEKSRTLALRDAASATTPIDSSPGASTSDPGTTPTSRPTSISRRSYGSTPGLAMTAPTTLSPVPRPRPSETSSLRSSAVRLPVLSSAASSALARSRRTRFSAVRRIFEDSPPESASRAVATLMRALCARRPISAIGERTNDGVPRLKKERPAASASTEHARIIARRRGKTLREEKEDTVYTISDF